LSIDIGLQEFASDLYQQVIIAKENDVNNFELEDFYTNIMLEYLEDIGEVEDTVICPFRGHGLQMNGYSISEEFDSIDLYVSDFIESGELKTLSRSDIDACLKRAIQLYRKAINDLYESFKKDTDTYGFASEIYNQKDKIRNVRIVALTNGIVKKIEFNNITIEGVDISFNIWDIERLYRCYNSGKLREVVEIDFLEKYNTTIECLENISSDKYCVYLAIVPGKILSELYKEYGPRLLERNVRSFLQAKGQVNKGMKNTLQEEPDMFLAYNNGISVTAESVEISRDSNGKPSIKKIKDMQIVNGGQTTASIFNSTKDKKNQVDLCNVYVQMKLSVIKDSRDANEIISRISTFANTQNKIQTADFSANDPFHRKIEELSRTIWTPLQNGSNSLNWFYERARGQYAEILSKQSTALRKKQFKEEHPLFSKTDLAKYENSWDQLPYHVSEGGQKNFKKFTLRLKERGNLTLGVKYYEHLIAKAILFKETERLVQVQNYGGYRANIVTYTIAFLSNKTSQRIDMDYIWQNQCLTDAIRHEIIYISRLVHKHIVDSPNGANIGEWCKNKKCWETLRDTEYMVSKELEDELISLKRASSVSSVPSGINSPTEEEKEVIEKVKNVPANTWFSISKWAKETNNLQSWQRSLLFSIGTILSRGKNPTYKQANQAFNAYNIAVTKGFNESSGG